MRLEEIQAALRAEGLDGWLFFDHHRRDPLAYRVLQFTPGSMVTRRWFYFVPAQGEPRGLAHKIEAETLSPLPGRKSLYAGWSTLVDGLRELLGGARRIAMQYSPDCAVPYVAMVDAGTVELVRGLGVEVASSANLVQHFESRWTREQLEMHLEAARKIDGIRKEAFERVGAKLRAAERVTEWEMQQFILTRFREEGLFTDHGPDIAVNANASNPHYDPKQDACTEIKKGDTILMDMWAKLDRPEAVYYDITWVGYCGERPPDRYQRVFEIVRDARDRAIQRVKDAIENKQELRGFEVDDAARSHIREHGFADYFFHRTGHSIGTEVHGSGANMDNLETHDERRVIPWTCFSVEPGIYLPEFGIRSEVDVFVGDGEARVTGEIQSQIVLIS
ncbi:MAG: aminopeptidase P family protein [Bryobacterales bacterium]|nr:aminopeptidase P family protein [Bryobacterales bacterium]